MLSQTLVPRRTPLFPAGAFSGCGLFLSLIRKAIRFVGSGMGGSHFTGWLQFPQLVPLPPLYAPLSASSAHHCCPAPPHQVRSSPVLARPPPRELHVQALEKLSGTQRQHPRRKTQQKQRSLPALRALESQFPLLQLPCPTPGALLPGSGSRNRRGPGPADTRAEAPSSARPRDPIVPPRAQVAPGQGAGQSTGVERGARQESEEHKAGERERL